jgi:hypothetical protein
VCWQSLQGPGGRTTGPATQTPCTARPGSCSPADQSRPELDRAARGIIYLTECRNTYSYISIGILQPYVDAVSALKKHHQTILYINWYNLRTNSKWIVKRNFHRSPPTGLKFADVFTIFAHTSSQAKQAFKAPFLFKATFKAKIKHALLDRIQFLSIFNIKVIHEKNCLM